MRDASELSEQPAWPPWVGPHRGGPLVADLANAMRRLQDAYTAAAPSPVEAAALRDALAELALRFEASGVDEPHQVIGRRIDLPGRGQTLAPPVHDLVFEETRRLVGTVYFSRFFLGTNGAVHGGAVALLFDDIMGLLMCERGGPRGRNAFLHVDYRKVTPIGRPLKIEAATIGGAGRKTSVTAQLSEGGRVIAEASALFVQLRANQT